MAGGAQNVPLRGGGGRRNCEWQKNEQMSQKSAAMTVFSQACGY